MRSSRAEESGRRSAVGATDLSLVCHDVLNCVASLQVNVEYLSDGEGSAQDRAAAAEDARAALAEVVRLMDGLRRRAREGAGG